LKKIKSYSNLEISTGDATIYLTNCHLGGDKMNNPLEQIKDRVGGALHNNTLRNVLIGAGIATVGAIGTKAAGTNDVDFVLAGS
jgi:hypothetical protein